MRLFPLSWVSSSFFSVILSFTFLLSCVFPSPPELRPAGRSLSQGLFAALPAIGPSLQYPLLPADECASYPRLDARLVPHLRAPSGARRMRVATSRTTLPIH